MSDPERILFEQEALARYPQTDDPTHGLKRRPFVEGAMFAAHLGRKQRRDAELRDGFAASALNALIATATGDKVDPVIIAQGAFAVADAMLAERDKAQAGGMEA